MFAQTFFPAEAQSLAQTFFFTETQLFTQTFFSTESQLVAQTLFFTKPQPYFYSRKACFFGVFQVRCLYKWNIFWHTIILIFRKYCSLFFWAFPCCYSMNCYSMNCDWVLVKNNVWTSNWILLPKHVRKSNSVLVSTKVWKWNRVKRLKLCWKLVEKVKKNWRKCEENVKKMWRKFAKKRSENEKKGI